MIEFKIGILMFLGWLFLYTIIDRVLKYLEYKDVSTTWLAAFNNASRKMTEDIAEMEHKVSEFNHLTTGVDSIITEKDVD